MTTDTTTITPPARTGRRWARIALNIVTAVGVVAVGYMALAKYGPLQPGPSIEATASCLPGGISSLTVDLAHMPGATAEVAAHTPGDTWAGGKTVHLDHHAGGYFAIRVPAGVVTVEVTPEGRGMTIQTVDVPRCEVPA